MIFLGCCLDVGGSGVGSKLTSFLISGVMTSFLISGVMTDGHAQPDPGQ